MGKKPFVDFLIGIGPAPGVVPNTRVEGQLRLLAPGLLDRLDHQLAELGLHHAIGITNAGCEALVNDIDASVARDWWPNVHGREYDEWPSEEG